MTPAESLVQFGLALPVALLVAAVIAWVVRRLFGRRLALPLSVMVIVSVLGLSAGILLAGLFASGARLWVLNAVLLAFGCSVGLSFLVAGIAAALILANLGEVLPGLVSQLVQLLGVVGELLLVEGHPATQHAAHVFADMEHLLEQRLTLAQRGIGIDTAACAEGEAGGKQHQGRDLLHGNGAPNGWRRGRTVSTPAGQIPRVATVCRSPARPAASPVRRTRRRTRRSAPCR